MSWSTSRLAEIAVTSVKSIRYYHRIGALPEPGRGTNGYKHYEVTHLVTLLRILRLTELGMSPRDLVRLDEPDADPWEALRRLDAHLQEQISRLTHVRLELAEILETPASDRPVIDLPAGMLGLNDDVSDADRAMLLIYSRLFDQETMGSLADLMRNRERGPAEEEFDRLQADADAATRQSLAERLAPTIAAVSHEYGWVGSLGPHMSHDSGTVSTTLREAFTHLYNPAQLDVMARVTAINDAESPETERDGA